MTKTITYTKNVVRPQLCFVNNDEQNCTVWHLQAQLTAVNNTFTIMQGPCHGGTVTDWRRPPDMAGNYKYTE